jgi:cyclophilin family peptidyl-prolyl cis-trans isomerase
MKILYKYFFIFCFCFAARFSGAQTNITFYTTLGSFDAVMYDTLQPITAGNFIDLVNAEFYDGILFHRVISGFVIQGGDPLGDGTGGPGYTIIDEINPETSNTQKTIAMANAGPNTGGSQFFINLVSNTYLNPNYPVFGKVVLNFSVVQAIGMVDTDGNDKPIVDVVMDSVRVTSAPVSLASVNLLSPSIEIYPNPASSKTMVSINSKKSQKIDFEIYNQSGKLIHSFNKNLIPGINEITFTQLQLTQLPNGIYNLLISDGVTKSSKKFVIEN